MIKLDTPEQNAIYLDHNDLINQSYNKYIEDTQKYHLHKQLFAFKPKYQNNEQQLSSKSRKRKAGDSSSTPEAIDLKLSCDRLLTKLKETVEIRKAFQEDDTQTLPRIWEEQTEFPELHGQNNRNDFQKFSLGKREYLIPPHSKFFNRDLLKLNDISKDLDKYDFVVIDPPWRNKYIRRIKKAKQELGYKMLNNDNLSDINISSLLHINSIVAIWCTNSRQHQQRMLEEFFPRWDLKLIHKITWLKLNTDGQLISDINDEGKKQPYEVLFVASHCQCTKDFSEIKKLEFILSVPSIIHSHKPPIIDIFRNILPENPKSVELFARYLQPDFTSIGLEVLKLMDTRLYFENK